MRNSDSCGDDGVIENSTETFYMLYYADITKFEELLESEIKKIELFDYLPVNCAYPEIQPKLLEKVQSIIGC